MCSICAYKFIVWWVTPVLQSKQAAGENSQTATPPQRKMGLINCPFHFGSSVPECYCIDYFSKEAQPGCLKVCFLREHFWIHNPVNVTWTKMVWAVYQTIFPLNGKLFWHETLGEWLKYSTFYSSDSGRLTFFKERARSQERLELRATNSHQTMSQWLLFAKIRKSSQSNQL